MSARLMMPASFPSRTTSTRRIMCSSNRSEISAAVASSPTVTSLDVTASRALATRFSEERSANRVWPWTNPK